MSWIPAVHAGMTCYLSKLIGGKGLLIRLGFDERIRGSHHVYRKEGIEEKLNLQQDDNKAKPYQVRQVRFIIIKYHLADEI